MIQIQPDLAWTRFARLSLALALFSVPLAAAAQSSGNGWFVPNAPKPAAPPPRPQAGAQPVVQSTAQPEANAIGQPSDQAMPLVEPQAQLPPLQAQLPPMPEIPAVAKGSPTPAAIVGILSVPDILRVATAYQAASKELLQRRNKANEDWQKELNAQRDLAQTLASERAKLSPEQVRAKEKEYADRVNEARAKFGDRARIIQEAGQYVMMQIERVIEQVAQQVAASRGVNLVLNRAQVLGTTTDFDLTPQVADVVNKVIPTVVIPPDGVSPTNFTAPVAGPRASAAPDAKQPAKN